MVLYCKEMPPGTAGPCLCLVSEPWQAKGPGIVIHQVQLRLSMASVEASCGQVSSAVWVLSAIWGRSHASLKSISPS